MFGSYIDGKRSSIMEQVQNRPMTSIFRIILNHWPLLTRPTHFIKPFINDLEPNIILKGDSHHVCKDFDQNFMKINFLFIVFGIFI
jgi:hypothetical protein